MTWKEGRKPQPGETRAEAAYLMERERERSAPSAKRDGRTDAKSNWTNVKIIDAQDAGQAAKPGAKLAEAQEQLTSPEVGYSTGLKLYSHLRLSFRSITWISPLRFT